MKTTMFFNTKPKDVIFTATGGTISIKKPRPEEINIEDIAIGLSRQIRYNGQLGAAFTVAQHSGLVQDLVTHSESLWKGFKRSGKNIRAASKIALIHDASEAYLGDITKNIKNMIAKKTHAYTDLEDSFDSAIRTKLGMDGDGIDDVSIEFKVVKAADHAAFFIETNSFATPSQRSKGVVNMAAEFVRSKGIDPEPFFKTKIRCLSATAARDDFLNRMAVTFAAQPK